MTHLEKAQEIKAKGSPLTIDQIVAFLVEKEAKAEKKMKAALKRWDKRDEMNAIKVIPMHSDDLREKYLLQQRKSAGLI